MVASLYNLEYELTNCTLHRLVGNLPAHHQSISGKLFT